MRADGLVDTTGHQTLFVLDVALGRWKGLPDNIVALDIEAAIDLFGGDREGQIPLAIVAYRLNKLFGDKQREIELTQSTVFALGAHKIENIGVANVKSRHLRAPPPARRRDGKAHLVKNIHKRQRPRSIGTSTRDVGTLGAQGRKFITDTATGLEREPGFKIALKYALHRVRHDARYGTVNGRGGWFVSLGTGVGDDSASRDRSVVQGPFKAFLP